jgi:hypothetical protein
MITKTVNGASYQLVPGLKPGSCQGCVARARNKIELCSSLRPECAQTSTGIWLEALPVQLLCPEPAPTPAAVKPKVVIQVVGGCVTYVCGNIDVEVVLCDYDTEGTEAQFDVESLGLKPLAVRGGSDEAA